MEIIVVAIMVLSIAGYFVYRAASKGAAQGKALAALRDKIASKYPGSELCMSIYGFSILAISFESEKVILGTLTSEDEFRFADIAEVEIVENGSTIIQTNRGSQLLTAAAGGVLFGGVGALAGALTGTKRSQVRINELVLKLTVDDNIQPIRRFLVFKTLDANGADPNAPLVKKLRDEAERFHALIGKGMRQAQSGATRT